MTTTPLRRIAVFLLGNRAAQIYLLVVLAAVLYGAIDGLLVTHEDASLAGIWMFVVTAPGSLFLLRVLPGDIGGVGIFLTVPVAALINLIVIGILVERTRREKARASRSS